MNVPGSPQCHLAISLDHIYVFRPFFVSFSASFVTFLARWIGRRGEPLLVCSGPLEIRQILEFHEGTLISDFIYETNFLIFW